MDKHRGENRTKCPISFALDSVGDKWSLLILRDILFKAKRHYGEFLDAPEKISTNILANRLQKLEADGLIAKERDPSNSARFVYSLTAKSADLVPLILEMIEWSVKYNPQPGTADHIIDGAPSDLLHRARRPRGVDTRDLIRRSVETGIRKVIIASAETRAQLTTMLTSVFRLPPKRQNRTFKREWSFSRFCDRTA